MLRLSEAAKIIGISHRGMYERLRRGKLPLAVKEGNRWVVPEEMMEPYRGTLTVRRAAAWLSARGGPGAPQSVYNYIAAGRLPAHRDDMGMVRVRIVHLEELLGIPERKAMQKRAKRELQP